MSKDRPLGEDEVRQIERIVDILNGSAFDHLHLEFGDLKLTIGRGGGGAAPLAPPAAAPASSAASPAAAAPASSAVPDGTVTVNAPMVGRFYSQPEPGAPAFVAVGDAVEPDTTVGLIEVMKTFNAVRAGVSGIVTELCVTDSEAIEYGQPLLRIRPKS